MTTWGISGTTRARGAAVVALVIAAAWVASGGAASAGTADSFAGRCSLHGSTRFAPAITPTPGPAVLTTDATGTCSGTLDGHSIDRAPVSMAWTAPVYADGCLAAHTTANGPGTLSFGAGRSIAFTAGFGGVLTAYALTIHGQRSGTAHGLASLATTRTDPVSTLSGCAGAQGGLVQTPVDIGFSTASPLVDGAAAARASFTGLCQLSGTVRFQPALTTTQQQGKVGVTATGTCTGDLIGPDGDQRSVRAAAARVSGGSSGSESCEIGMGQGAATLTVAGEPLAFSYREVRVGPALALTATGRRGGSALAEGNISPTADPLAILGACAASGLTSAPIDVRVFASGLG